MTSISNFPIKPLGFMKLAFIITPILSVFLSLSAWFILNDAFKKELKENTDQSQKDLSEPNNTNLALQKEIAEMKAEKTVKVNEFNNLKMEEIDSLFEAAKRKRKDKDDQEKVSSTEEKDLPTNPVFKSSELEPLLAFKMVKSILEKQISKDFSLDKFKGNPITLNDGFLEFVNKRKGEITKSEKYKLEFGKKWLKEIEDKFKVDREKAFDHMNIKEKAPSKISAFSDNKAEFEGEVNMMGLKNLLLEIPPKNVNLFFAFSYFPKDPGLLKSKIRTSSFKMDTGKEGDKIAAEVKKMLDYFTKYEKFLESLTVKPQ